MIGRRTVVSLLSAAIFFLQGGDCLSLFAASKQTRDCCRKGHCGRSNPDPCCQVSSKANIAQDQVKEKTPAPVLAVLPIPAMWMEPAIETSNVWAQFRVTFAPSPPWAHGSFALPLLV